MKITDISIDQLLYTKPVNSRPYDSAEEPGFFNFPIDRGRKSPYSRRGEFFRAFPWSAPKKEHLV